MEIDVDAERNRIQAELKMLTDQVTNLGNQITFLQQQRQEMTNQVLLKSGELRLLNRLNGQKEV